MSTADAIWRLLADPATWWGAGGLAQRTWEHLGYSGAATALAAALALPVGLWTGHTGRGGFLAIQAGNVGRAIPTFGLLLAAFTFLGLGLAPILIALTALGIPPILTNTYVGLREVDPEVRDAAEGLGMTASQLLARVELPLAAPLIMTGLRTAAVQVVATATLAAVAASGGLGRPIVDGLAQGVQFNERARALVIVGALAVALLAMTTELALGRVERALGGPAIRPVDPTRPERNL